MPVRSFPPEAGRGAKALILGSMPGAASLKAGQYYAHPRNAFWRIILDTFGGKAGLPYPARLRLLKNSGFALWDVLASCERPGSSDSAIRRGSIVPNDLAGFLAAHPELGVVLFNGAKAEDCYRRRVLPYLPPRLAALELRRLPSTSPAHAALTYARKLKIWKTCLLAVARRVDINGK